MKKILSMLLIFIFCSNTVLAGEIARLYRVSGVNDIKMEEIIKPTLNITGYKVINKDKFYLIEKSQDNIYNVIVLKNNGTDCYYYFLSNESLKINERILDKLESQDLKKKRIRNSALLTLFHSEADDFMRNATSGIKAITGNNQPVFLNKDKNYDFSDEAQWRFDTNTAAISPQIPLTVPQEPVIQLPETAIHENALKGSLVHIDAGELFNATLTSAISSDSITNNDRISAQLDSDWIVSGIKIAPLGSIVSGEIVNTRSAGYAMQDGKIGINFTEILTPDGKIIPLSTNKVQIIADGNRALNITKKIATGALGGLMFGAILLLCGADTKSLLGGAAVGGTVGALSAAATKGEELFVPEGTILQIMLAEPMTAQPYINYN